MTSASIEMLSIDKFARPIKAPSPPLPVVRAGTPVVGVPVCVWCCVYTHRHTRHTDTQTHRHTDTHTLEHPVPGARGPGGAGGQRSGGPLLTREARSRKVEEAEE